MKMNKKTLLYVIIALLWTVGVIGFCLANNTIDWIVIGLFSGFFAILIWVMIIMPLVNYFFGIQGSKNYEIKKGNHRTSIWPFFKPLIFGGKYMVKITFYPSVFDTINHVPLNDLGVTDKQINKLFGFNYGFKIKKQGHSNSIRLGYNLHDFKIKLFLYNSPNNFLYIDSLKPDKYGKSEIQFMIDSKNSVLIINESEFHLENFVKYKKLGYYLPKPYFGGKKVVPNDINFSYTIIKIK